MGRRIRKRSGGLFDQLKGMLRVELEESSTAERGTDKLTVIDPWLEICPAGTRGHLYVHGLDPPVLGVAVTGKRRAAQLGREFPELVPRQVGDDGTNFSAPYSDQLVLRLADRLQCRRVRQATEADRERGRRLASRTRTQDQDS